MQIVDKFNNKKKRWKQDIEYTRVFYNINFFQHFNQYESENILEKYDTIVTKQQTNKLVKLITENQLNNINNLKQLITK